MDSDEERMRPDDDEGAGGGGRRGMRAAAGRERSAVAFNSHRVAEWRREAVRQHHLLLAAPTWPTC